MLHDVEALIPADTVDDDSSANVGLLDLDEAADLCEGDAAAVLVPANDDANTDVRADINAFVIPENCALVELCPEIKTKELKKTGKFAYKFAEGWDTATFRGPYKGRDANLKGGFDLYFQAFKRKVTVKLLQSEYGVEKTWIAFKTKS